MDTQSRLNTYWSTRAADYAAFQEAREALPGVGAAWRGIWEEALPDGVRDVLEVGCGSGTVTRQLATLGHRVTGIDLAEGMLREANARPVPGPGSARYLADDAVCPDFAPASFDAIVCRYLLWALMCTREALPRWRDLLRPGGVVACVDALWYPEGIEAIHTGADHHDAAFLGTYDQQVRGDLDLAEARSIEVHLDAFRAAGFDDIAARPLPALMDLDRRWGVAPGHRPRLQFLILAGRGD